MGRTLRIAVAASLVLGFASPLRAADFSCWNAASITMLDACPNGGIKAPGSDTCIRLGGRLRAETIVSSSSAAAGRGAFKRSLTTMRTAGAVSVDVRTPTELGPVRAYAEIRGAARGTPQQFGR